MLVAMSRVWTWWRGLVRPLTVSSARLVTKLWYRDLMLYPGTHLMCRWAYMLASLRSPQPASTSRPRYDLVSSAHFHRRLPTTRSIRSLHRDQRRLRQWNQRSPRTMHTVQHYTMRVYTVHCTLYSAVSSSYMICLI